MNSQNMVTSPWTPWPLICNPWNSGKSLIPVGSQDQPGLVDYFTTMTLDPGLRTGDRHYGVHRTPGLSVELAKHNGPREGRYWMVCVATQLPTRQRDGTRALASNDPIGRSSSGDVRGAALMMPRALTVPPGFAASTCSARSGVCQEKAVRVCEAGVGSGACVAE